MKPQFNNQVVSSFLLYLDNLLCSKGEAYYNVSGYFYETQNLYNSYYSYAASYSQIVYDQSVTGATTFTGLYLDNTWIGTGSSGLAQIDYKNGKTYFNTAKGNNRISGSFAIQEFSTAVTAEPEQSILFETKKYLRPKITEPLTGINTNEIVYPCIFIKDNGSYNKPFAFGGMDSTCNEVRLIVLGDSQFSTDAVVSLIRDQTFSYVPLFSESEFPFNAYGGLKNGVFNYTGVTANKTENGSGIFIKEAYVTPFNKGFKTDVDVLGANVFPVFIDLVLEHPRYPRQ